MDHTESSIKDFIVDTLNEAGQHFGTAVTNVKADANLMAEGIIDSLGFVSLMSAIELKYDIELEFDGTDPEEFMTINGLVARTFKALQNK